MSTRLQPDESETRAGNAPAAASPQGPPLVPLDAAIFKDVRVQLRARLGEATLTVEDLLALKAGSVVTLDSPLNAPVELRLNASVVARGEIVAVGEHFGLRIVDVAKTS
jgi:flagellar motor switch protein FliN/FliY